MRRDVGENVKIGIMSAHFTCVDNDEVDKGGKE